jgi:U3 small nucleolar RNA-associated protein 5
MSTKRKAAGKLATPTLKQSAKRPTKSTIDESRTSVAGADIVPDSQAETIEISSDADSDEDFSDEDVDTLEPQVNGVKDKTTTTSQQTQLNGKHTGPLPNPNRPSTDEDVEIEDVDADDVEGESTSPSFGELLRGNDAIDVPALLQQSNAGSRAVQSANTAIVAPSHQSLTTVLSQALRTDDVDLLESCLHTTDLSVIRNTIETIDTSLAGILLNKLAARLHRRPGRAGSLMTWVRWTLVAHGGALASQPKVVQSLSSLQKVLAERAKGLNSLLALKGKLDLLEGQMEMRRKLQHRSRRALQNGEDDEEEEEDVVWVEGEKNGVNVISSDRIRAAEDDEEEDGFAANGVLGDSSDEDDDEDEDEEDSDAEDDQLDEDEVDHDDVDESMGEDEDSDIEAAPPSKVQRVAGSFSKKK